MKTLKYVSGSFFVVLAILVWAAFNSAGDPPAVGDDAPGFTLTSNEGKEVSLTDYRDSWVVLYFYPRDFTRGCTIEAHNFQRDLDLYSEKNAVILGVSVDDAQSHSEFCAKEGLTFKLLADVNADVSEAYGSVVGLKDVKISARNTFVIDPNGKIAKVFIGVKPNPHSAEVLAALVELQAD